MRPTHRTYVGGRGFTLIELIVVLAIAAGLIVVILGAVRSVSGAPVRTEIMRFSGAMRSAYQRAAINGERYDIVLNIDDNSYQLQCSDQLLAAERQLESNARQRAFGRNERDPFAEETEEAEAPRRDNSLAEEPLVHTAAGEGMGGCSDELLQARTLERDIEIVRVQTERTGEPVEEGIVNIAIFPNGTMERSAIWLRHGEKHWTFLIDEMTGQIEIAAEELERLDDYFVVRED